MKRLLNILSILLFVTSASAQSTPKIKILLLGTFHFDQTSDNHKTEFPDLMSSKRQQELQLLTTKLAQLHPDKIFVENLPKRQMYWDSVYTRYQKGTIDTTKVRNEIFQLGMRTAKKAGLPGVICVDYDQALPYAKLNEFDKRTSKDSVALRKMAAYKLLNVNYPYPKHTKKLSDLTLTDYFLYINSPQYDAGNRADYFVYAPAAGYDDDYTGVDFITSWYERNAKIFTNILRKSEPTDKMHIVIFGASHMLPLRHYFQMHPYFEVVELSDILK